MDRFIDIIGYIIGLSNVHFMFINIKYSVIYIVPIVVIGIFIITTVVRFLVRQVHY